jgi:glutamate/tyrosine decarboxylase-like PLP-dependent enzyme
VDRYDHYAYLAQFLGPKGENAEVMEGLLVTILRDHVHWRRNYFPDDRPLLTPSRRRSLEEGHDRLEGEVGRAMAELRRNFPFFSPRYIGHQLSDVSMPALLGYFAGMLYNPNNVTSEAAPVTAGWELDACARVLKLLGYTPPPAPPTTVAEIPAYEAELQKPFGFAHITSGGTLANMEALWVARNVRYSVLAVKDGAEAAGIDVDVTMPNGETRTVAEVDYRDLLGIHPSEAIALKERLTQAWLLTQGPAAQTLKSDEVSAAISSLLMSSPYDLREGWAKCAAEFPPVIFTSGAAHYSVRKAADALGIGAGRVRTVTHDETFRLDVAALEEALRKAQQSGDFPLVVVAVAGTTEEGAIDPVHEVLSLRDRLEASTDRSFWIHIDAAWGGFFRTLFELSPAARMHQVAVRVGKPLGVPFDGHDLSAWHERLAAAAARQSGSAAALRHDLDEALAADDEKRHGYALTRAADFLGSRLTDEDVRFSSADHRAALHDFTSTRITLRLGTVSQDVPVDYNAEAVLKAFEAFGGSDSITVDPHKMGYVGYPCGIVAFRDDRVRHAIAHEAPYITARSQTDAIVHQPPMHVDLSKNYDKAVDIPVNVSALASYMLEGSKPGAAAASLLLATSTLPLHLHEHGAVVRSTVLAARELYEWLARWRELRTRAAWPGKHQGYEIVPCTPGPPDTNIVTFVVVPTGTGSTLEEMNNLADRVYSSYSIQVELGAREHSYGQPFFLSRTTCTDGNYPLAALKPLFARCGLTNVDEDYPASKLMMLRASVMSPYITPLREAGLQAVSRRFVLDLDQKIEAALEAIAEEKKAKAGADGAQEQPPTDQPIT